MYAISNLTTLHNDIVLLKRCNLLREGSKIKTCLSILENSEVFLELFAARRFNKSKIWILIFMIQTVK